MTGETIQRHSKSISGTNYFAPVNRGLSTAVELDIFMLTSSHISNAGDGDNRLKHLLDGLTSPANAQQAAVEGSPHQPTPFYCLMDDDKLVSRIGLDVRPFTARQGELDRSLSFPRGSILGANASIEDRIDNVMLVL